ncbi:MAG: M12 family metallopeptidase [Geminicoccales bacterium]
MTTAPKMCFDRLLPGDLAAIDPNLEGLIPIGKTWPTGSTLRVRFLEGTTDQRGLAMAQANWWTEHANLQFVESDDLESEIRVTFDRNDGAWSYLGTDNRRIPTHQPTMNLGFQDGGTSAHEFGHAISLAHEHQNPDGGIQWNEAEVIRDLSGPPNEWTEDQIRHNVLRKYTADQIQGTVFDPGSIMLYAFPARWTLNGIGTNANETLSETDKAFAAKIYPGRDGAGSSISLNVNGVATEADIGEPGEEDLFSFNADDVGRYVIETGGRTDVIMKLYGPNDRTRLIAEDDDGGLGLNSRIVRHLPRGNYLVQIRHYNRNSGTGRYSISVKM